MRDIIGKRNYFYALSIGLSLASIFALSMWGLNRGIDFKGGTLMEMEFSQARPEKSKLEQKIASLNLKSLTIQLSGDKNVITRYLSSDDTINDRVMEVARSFDKDVRQVRVDFIGSSVSSDLTRKAIIAFFIATLAIALFIAWAFREVSHPIQSWQYGLWSIVALLHDILITLGVFSVLGRFWDVEIGVPFVAALLTILGYSINDTIVVYDRTRENLLRLRAKEDFVSIVNRSLNETLARSFNTSFTVLLVLLAIIVFGGESIRYFAVALFVGVGAGTYSSIFVASSLLATTYRYKQSRKRA